MHSHKANTGTREYARPHTSLHTATDKHKRAANPLPNDVIPTSAAWFADRALAMSPPISPPRIRTIGPVILAINFLHHNSVTVRAQKSECTNTGTSDTYAHKEGREKNIIALRQCIYTWTRHTHTNAH